MYSSEDGLLTDWHLVHLGQFALRGVGLVIVEATAVRPEGRITPHDSGIWDDKHIAPLKKIVDYVHSQGIKICIQLAHAGRKATTNVPYVMECNPTLPLVVPPEYGGWPDDVVAPSAIPWDSKHANPRELTVPEIHSIQKAFIDAAKRAIVAGFDVIELHYAHGYLGHEFLSPISNKRTDEYGGSFENRIRFNVEVARKAREVWPDDKPLFVRISATDWVKNEESWTVDDSVKLVRKLEEVGVDFVDVSSGGNTPAQKITVGPGYQVPFAEKIKKETNLLIGSVGMIREPKLANDIVASGKSDIVLLGRQFLADGSWVFRAAEELGVIVKWPNQYHRCYRVKL
jgi:2,4-dienoyl-CoA reductase-like NADH-dependent reductase (Old Yellow Enzyme family)